MTDKNSGVVLEGKDTMLIRSQYVLARLTELAAETGMTKKAILEEALLQMSERLGIVEAVTTGLSSAHQP